jgi:CTP:molybdopterin cytidylyltransferase MocA
VREVTVVIFLHPPRQREGPLTRLLRDAQRALAERHRALFAATGAVVRVDDEAGQFATRLRAHSTSARGGLVVLGGGAVPLLSRRDAERLIAVAASTGRRALTNNRYSSDVCALSDAAPLRDAPLLPSDNVLPRWLAETAGFAVTELPGRDRLALDLDTPLDLALVALAPRAPAAVRAAVAAADLAVPRFEELRAVATDPRRELLVFGRSSARTIAWLERNVACRVRFLAEERGLRASALPSSPEPDPTPPQRPPRATLGRLLDARGPAALSATVAELADAAVIDSRVLLADRLGRDERTWPSPEDRFASDLLRASDIDDPWLADLTRSAAAAEVPILLGGHTLVGPGLQLLFNTPGARRRAPPPKGRARSLS